MLSFFRSKERSKPKPPIIEMEMSWFDRCVDQSGKLPRVNWEAVYQYSGQHYDDQSQEALWCNIARYWMEKLVDQLPGNYSQLESDNFLLVSAGDERYNKNLSNFLERCLKRLLFVSKGVFSDEGYGKYVVVVFDSVESYYDYVGYLYGADGEYGLSSGMYINNGYGHFVFTQQELNTVEQIAAHEMTHALLSHLPIPLWLNEGMAVNMESFITGYRPEGLTESIFHQHQNFWKSDEIQQFWQGESFYRPDEGQGLSYQLAQILVPQLSKDADAFERFINKAHHSDAGEKAMQEVYGMSLGDLLTGFLGEGAWEPTPSLWLSNS